MPQAELEMRKNRSVGLDVTRIYAFLSVVAVHSFLNTEFYSSTVIGKKYGIKQLMHFKIL